MDGQSQQEFADAKTELDKQGEQGSVVISEWAVSAAEVAGATGVVEKEEADAFADAESFEDAEETAGEGQRIQ